MLPDHRFSLSEAQRLGIYVPGLLLTIARQFSDADAWALAEEHAGQVVYIPQDANKALPRFPKVSRECVEYLCEKHGGGPLTVPCWSVSTFTHRIFRIRSLIVSGASVSSVVQECRCHEKTVRRHRTAMQNAGLLPDPDEAGHDDPR